VLAQFNGRLGGKTLDWEIMVGLGILLALLIFAMSKISGLSKTMADVVSKINTMTAPADTLTAVTTALQENVGGLQESISLMGKSVTDISTQAMKIEMIGKKYEETEELTRRIHNHMIGSYEKGTTGETLLRQILNDLMKIGFIRQDVPIGSRKVEYCVTFSDGKLLPIDSKVIATKDVDIFFDEEASDAERKVSRKKITDGLKKRLGDVSSYIDPTITLPYAIMAVPDSIVPLSADLIPEAVSKSVMVVGYSSVPQLIVYFIKIHAFYSIKEDVAELKDRLSAIQNQASKLDDSFFANRFDKPMKTIANAVSVSRSVVGGINSLLRLEYTKKPELPEEISEK